MEGKTKTTAQVVVPVTERCLLPAMLFQVVEALAKNGTQIRGDILHYLNIATITPLRDAPSSIVQSIATEVCRHVDTLTKSINEDDPRAVMLVICLFIQRLVDEGLFLDPGNQAVLAALLMVQEAKEVDGDGWPVMQVRYLAKASDLVRRAQLLGLFIPIRL